MKQLKELEEGKIYLSVRHGIADYFKLVKGTINKFEATKKGSWCPTVVDPEIKTFEELEKGWRDDNDVDKALLKANKEYQHYDPVLVKRIKEAKE